MEHPVTGTLATVVQATGALALRQPLLHTKLHVPYTRPDLVRRPRLTAMIDEGLQRKLILISAPAGFGKTTLVSEWLSAQGAGAPPVAWLALDESENDLERFLTYFIAALQTVRLGLGEGVLADLYAPHPPKISLLLTALINELATVPEPFVFVLDDYHAIESPEVHDVVAFLLEHMPLQMHLVLTTRLDPPLPLSLLRVRGAMEEIRASDLRFTAEESADFLNRVMGLDLTSADVLALETRTEGWIAALQLAALSLEKNRDVSAFLEAFSGSHRYLVDYLTSEVLRAQPEPVQSFLLETSVLTRLSGPLCDAVTGRSDGQAMLETLEQENLFVVSLDTERRWYRYHHLFSDFLQDRLNHRHAERVPELHRRASAWYEANGLIARAVRHTLALGDVDESACLIERSARQMVMWGEMRALMRWLEAIPEEMIRLRPRLCLADAWVQLFLGRPESVESRLERVELYLQERWGVSEQALYGPAQPSETEVAELLGEIITFRAAVAAQRHHLSRTIELSKWALRVIPRDESFLRGAVLFNLGGAYVNHGNLPEGERALTEAKDLCLKVGNFQMALRAINTLAVLEALRGYVNRALALYSDAVDLAMEPDGRMLPVAGVAYVTMGEVYYLLYDLETAAEYLTEGIRLCRQWGDYERVAYGYLNLARIHLAQEDEQAADSVIATVMALQQKHDLQEEFAEHIGRRVAQIDLMRGDVAAARRWANSRDLSTDDEIPYRYEYDYMIYAQLLIAEGDFDAALHLLDRLIAFSAARGWALRHSQLVAMKTVALEGQGKRAAALDALEEALRLVAAEQPILTFVAQGPVIAALLGQLALRGRFTGYVEKLLDAFGEVADVPAFVLPTQAAVEVSLPEPLTDREMEVLELMAQGKTNREIAEALVLAVGTVKKHTNNIFQKLNVHNRTQAVARARALDLLP